MPGSVHDLTRKLMGAIDPQGHVQDMGAVVDVVSALEAAKVTADDLKVTRLGKYINLIRRKLSDKSLARRMKRLVKQWQKLLSPTVPNGPANPAPSPASRALNGVAAGKTREGPSPVPSSPPESPHPPPTHVPGLTSSSSSSLSVSLSTSSEAVGPSLRRKPTPPPRPTPSPTPPPSRPTDPTAQRMKLLQRMSEVRTQPPPAPAPTSVPLVAQSHAPSAQSSLSSTTASNHSRSNVNSALELHPRPSAHAQPTHESHSTSPPPTSLTLSFPLNSHLRQLESRLETRTKPLEAHPTLGLIVRIPRHSLTRLPSEHRGKQLRNPSAHVVASSHKESRRVRRLVVSVSTSLLQRVPAYLTAQPESPFRQTEPHSAVNVPNEVFPQDDVLKAEPDPPHVVPDDAIHGVDGCRGRDGLWYRWTDSIPGEDLSVTVLPYIYIDGLEPLDGCL